MVPFQISRWLRLIAYTGIDIEQGHEVAIKLTDGTQSSYSLGNEKDAYAALVGGVGVPRVWWLV